MKLTDDLARQIVGHLEARLYEHGVTPQEIGLMEHDQGLWISATINGREVSCMLLKGRIPWEDICEALINDVHELERRGAIRKYES